MSEPIKSVICPCKRTGSVHPTVFTRGLCIDCYLEDSDLIHKRFILKQDWRTAVEILHKLISAGAVSRDTIKESLSIQPEDGSC